MQVNFIRINDPHHGKAWEVFVNERLQLLDVPDAELGAQRVVQQLEPVPPQVTVSLLEEGFLVARVLGRRGHFEVLSYRKLCV